MDMDYMKELMRIAEKTEDKKDAEILVAAACQLAPMVKPKTEQLTEIPGWGYQYSRLY